MGSSIRKTKRGSKICSINMGLNQPEEKENPDQNIRNNKKKVTTTYKNYNPVGEIQELNSGADSDNSPSLNPKKNKLDIEVYSKLGVHSLPNILSKKTQELEEKIGNVKKKKATELLLSRVKDEKNFDLENKSYLNMLYTDFFHNIQQKEEISNISSVKNEERNKINPVTPKKGGKETKANDIMKKEKFSKNAFFNSNKSQFEIPKIKSEKSLSLGKIYDFEMMKKLEEEKKNKVITPVKPSQSKKLKFLIV